MKTYAVQAVANKSQEFIVSGRFKKGSTGQVVFVNASSASSTISNAASFYESNAQFVIPDTYITSANLPATFQLQVNEGTGFVTVATGTIALAGAVSPTADTEIKNDAGNPINVTPAVSAGVQKQLAVDAVGNLRTLNTTGTQVTGNLTTVGNAVTANTDGYSSFTFYFTGTFVGANIAFEQSPDGTNWYPTLAANISTNVIATTTGVFAAASAFDLTVAAASQVRARLTAITSGTVATVLAYTTANIEVAPAIGTHAVTGSGTFTVAGAATTTPVAPSAISFVSAASTNAAVDKATAGSLFEVTASNVTATAAFLKFYNKATAPTVGTDVPVLTISVPANTTVAIQFGPVGKRFITGIGRAITAAAAATDTAVTVAGIQVHYSYI